MNSFETDLLLIPGPTPVPPPVARALSEPMISHRGGEFKEMFGRTLGALQSAFKTRNDIVLLTASGTGGMEAALANTLSPGDRVLCLENGKFGERFAEIGERYGLEVVKHAVEWGRGLHPEGLAKVFAEADKPFKAMTLIHNETSAGVTNPTKDLVRVAREHGALTIVDCISGLLCTEFAMDEWGVDIAVSGSQKALAIPPGLAFVAMSERAWAMTETSALPRYYFDLPAMRKDGGKGQTSYTPAVTLIRGLDVSLAIQLADGPDPVIARHKLYADAVRAGVRAMGLPLFAEEGFESNGVTAIAAPEGLDPEKVRGELKRRFDIVLSGGQSRLKGKIFRISHMGAVPPYQLLGALAALEVVLRDQGWDRFSSGAGVAAAGEVFGAGMP